MPRKKFDYLLALSVVGLAVFGMLMVYSASFYVAEKTYGDGYFFLKKQAIGFVAGLICMSFFAWFDYKKLRKFTLPLLIVSYVLLLLVFVPGISKESYGAKRWIRLFGFTVQPSEIAKFAYILFFSAYASKDPKRIKGFLGILLPLIVGAGFLLLIILEPNMSITVCFAAMIFLLLFLSGTRKRNLFYLVVPAILAIPVLIMAEPYRLKRLSAFLDPWAAPKGEGYQLLQSLYAIGSGGWFGVGLFQSRQKYQFLPFAESDFILSVIAEELGFLGCISLFFVVGLIVFRGIKIAKSSPDLFGFLLSCGVIAIFFLQIAVNALVVTGTIPPTGLPFPLLSSGNTSMIVFMSEFGILLNISSQKESV